jgi:hypothetical protein
MFEVDLVKAATVLDGMKSEGCLYSAISGLVRPDDSEATRTF